MRDFDVFVGFVTHRSVAGAEDNDGGAEFGEVGAVSGKAGGVGVSDSGCAADRFDKGIIFIGFQCVDGADD